MFPCVKRIKLCDDDISDEVKDDTSDEVLQSSPPRVHYAARCRKHELANHTDEFGYTQLHLACRSGSMDVVEKFLELGHNPNCPAQKSVDPPLHLALFNGKMDVVRLLLKYGADPNVVNARGFTILQVICQGERDDDDTARKLLRISRRYHKTVNVNAQSRSWDTALHLALAKGHARLAELLLRNGAHPNLFNADGSTPLHIICRRKVDDDLAEKFFQIVKDMGYPLQVDPFTRLKGTSLHSTLPPGKLLLHLDPLNRFKESSLHWSLSPRKQLLQDDAWGSLKNTSSHWSLRRGKQSLKVDASNRVKIIPLQVDPLDYWKNTPLHWALRCGNRKAAESLLRRGAEPHWANADRSTPLHIVCERNDYESAKMLFEIGDKSNRLDRVNARNKLGNTPLHSLLLNLREEMKIAELLLRKGANPNMANNEGSTPLHLICRLSVKHLDLVNVLFEMCNDVHEPVLVDAKDKSGNAPLHLAVRDGNDGLIEALLRRGANPNLTDAQGSTCLHIICQENNDDDALMRLFFKFNDELNQEVRLDARDNLNRTALELAVANLCPNVVGVLLDRGADLSSFVFPKEIRFDGVAEFEEIDEWKSMLASSCISIIERLEAKGYELYQGDAFTIMAFFDKYGLRDRKSVELEPPIRDIKETLDNIMIEPDLSFYDLLFESSSDEAAKLLACANPYEFFRAWVLDCFTMLIDNWLPANCCEPILALMSHDDMVNVCLAAARQLQSDQEMHREEI